ncbi:MAG: T9SS type A sorting domain-containing protein [Crocinitomix sp.]|nr:T9SS type A sorting domain-containing protein [Crocinitomix sp.]
MKFITNSTGFAIGYGGDIYRISDESATIETKDPALDIAIYPNPIANELTIQVPEAALGGTFTIYNLIGAEMRTIQVTGTSMLVNCSEFTQGHYVGVFRRDDILITKLFVKL